MTRINSNELFNFFLLLLLFKESQMKTSLKRYEEWSITQFIRHRGVYSHPWLVAAFNFAVPRRPTLSRSR